jgi:hypothetical protein
MRELTDFEMANIWGGSGGGGSAPAPDPALEAAETQNAAISQQEWNLYKKQILPQEMAEQKQQDAVADQQATADTQLAQQQYALSQQEDQQYQNVYVPAQDQMATEAANYNTQGNFEQQAQLAMGDTTSAFNQAKQAQGMQMQSYGVDPTSGAYQGQMAAQNTNEAAAEASAATRARQAATQMGWNMQSQVVGQGDTAANLENATTASASNTGSAATSQAGVAAANTAQTQNTLSQAGGTAISGMSAAGSEGEAQYNTGVNAWSAQQQANAEDSAGVGKAIGAIGAASSTSVIGTALTSLIGFM